MADKKTDFFPQLKPAPVKDRCGDKHEGHTCTRESGHLMTHIDIKAGVGWL